MRSFVQGDLQQRLSRFVFYGRIALRSSDPARRLTDLVLANLLFAMPASVRRWLFAGTRAFCPVCNARLTGFLTLHRPYHR